jgi:gas vesicle protein
MRKGFAKGLLIGSVIGASVSMAMNSDMMGDRSRRKMRKNGMNLMRKSGAIIGDVLDLLR